MKKKNLSAKKKIPKFYSDKLNDPRIKKIYLEFKNKLCTYKINNFSVAVSGGVDSMALSFLTKCYSLEKNKKIPFFIVDHNIRKNSTSEANSVKKKLHSLKIKSEILTIQKIKKKSNIQSFARENRYDLIFKKCLSKKLDAVLTAHHKDDLIENFFIRLLRGSGLKGLSSFGNIKSQIKINNKIFIFRPLLNTSKKDLTYISKKTFNFKVDDPSNLNDKYLRVRVRKLISKLRTFGLTFNKFKNSLDNLNKSNSAIEHYVKKNIKDNSNYLPISKTVILNQNFINKPDDIVFRSFMIILQKVGRKDLYTRGMKVENLLRDLKDMKKFGKKTLSGCIIQKIEKSVIISPEKL